MPVNASSLYAKNLLAFLETMIDKKDKALKVNWDDEIIKGTLVAKDGKHRAPEPAARGREMTHDAPLSARAGPPPPCGEG